MGLATPAAVLPYGQTRQNVSMHEVLAHYGVSLLECGEDEDRMQCACPLPCHGSNKRKKTFRIYSWRGNFTRWKCFSKTCAAQRAFRGDDVVTFVALMEGCGLDRANTLLREWFAANFE